MSDLPADDYRWELYISNIYSLYSELAPNTSNRVSTKTESSAASHDPVGTKE